MGIEASILVGHGAPFTALQIADRIADSTAAKIAEERLKKLSSLFRDFIFFFEASVVSLAAIFPH